MYKQTIRKDKKMVNLLEITNNLTGSGYPSNYVKKII